MQAIGITFAQFAGEARLELSPSDSEIARDFHAILDRLLEADAMLKRAREPQVRMQKRRTRRPTHTVKRGTAAAGPFETYPDAATLPEEKIPDRLYLRGARYAFRVIGDSMVGSGLLDGSVIFARPSVDLAAADGEIVVCRLNGALYVKRLDLRGSEIALHSENPRYSDIEVDEEVDEFALVGLVVL